MALLNNDRLSHWYVGVFSAWTIFFLLFCIPIFNLGLGFSIIKIAVSTGICCGTQLVVTPWLYYARSTPQNPDGLVGLRTLAVFVWLSLSALLLFYYIQRGWPSNQAAYQARVIMSISLVVVLIILGVFLRFNMRTTARIVRYFRGKDGITQGSGDPHPRT
jgi:hypothetical protein